MSEEKQQKQDTPKPVEQTVQINKPANVAPISAETTSAPTSTPTPAAEAPLVVSEADVKQVSKSSNEQVDDEIEVLTGEIQALESKIDRLTSNVEPTTPTPAAPSAPTPPVPVTPPAPTETPKPPVEEKLAINKEEPEIIEEKPTPAPAPIAHNAEHKVDQQTKGVNDIYTKVAETQKKAEEKEIKDLKEVEGLDEGGGFMDILGTVSDIVAVFGVIVFMALMLSPFYKQYLSEGIVDAMKSIGWLSAGICMGLALVMSLAVKGKWSSKVMLLIFLILIALMWLGINKSSLLGPLNTYLETLFKYYI